MSKNSARSKGYRPSKSSRKPFTAKEKRFLVIAAAVLVIALAGVIVIPNAVQSARLHLVGTDSNGVVKGIQDNWLVANLSKSSGTRQYSHVANAQPVDGYTLKGTGYLTDPNARTVYFEAPGAEIPEYTATIANGNYAEIALNFSTSQDIVLTEVIEQGDIEQSTIAGHAASAFWVNGTIDSLYDDDGNAIDPTYDDEGNAVYPQKYQLAAYCYVESPNPGLSVLLSITMFNTEENVYPDPSTLMSLLASAAERIEFL